MADAHFPSLEEILQRGTPFVPLPEFSILDLPHDLNEWVEDMLHRGEPFIIRNFNKLGGWDSQILTLERLANTSSVKSTWLLLLARGVEAKLQISAHCQKLPNWS
jgi:hypothetical protein